MQAVTTLWEPARASIAACMLTHVDMLSAPTCLIPGVRSGLACSNRSAPSRGFAEGLLLGNGRGWKLVGPSGCLPHQFPRQCSCSQTSNLPINNAQLKDPDKPCQGSDRRCVAGKSVLWFAMSRLSWRCSCSQIRTSTVDNGSTDFGRVLLRCSDISH